MCDDNTVMDERMEAMTNVQEIQLDVLLGSVVRLKQSGTETVKESSSQNRVLKGVNDKFRELTEMQKVNGKSFDSLSRVDDRTITKLKVLIFVEMVTLIMLLFWYTFRVNNRNMSTL
jgi:hypothetical protein